MLFRTFSVFGVLFSILMLSSFSKKPLTETALMHQRFLSDTPVNALTAAERAKGWKLLFDGHSLKGWRTYQNKKADSWSAVGGNLYCGPRNAAKNDLRSDLISVDSFDNFELSLDWKISPQGNSGILYMVQESESGAHLTGPEYQLIDDVNFPEKLENWQKTGANYAMDPAPEARPNPAGEWNHARIIVKGNHVEHWLNGKKIVSYTLYTDKWKKQKAEGKWHDAPHYAETKRGHIALQDHGSEASFRNIKIRIL